MFNSIVLNYLNKVINTSMFNLNFNLEISTGLKLRLGF